MGESLCVSGYLFNNLFNKQVEPLIVVLSKCKATYPEKSKNHSIWILKITKSLTLFIWRLFPIRLCMHLAFY